MSAVDVVMVIVVLSLVAAGAAILRAHIRHVDREYRDSAPTELDEEVAKLRAEVRELRSTRKRRSTFMDMADALNRLSNPPAKTKSGTKFRFRRGGEDGRDLHLTVRATPETSS